MYKLLKNVQALSCRVIVREKNAKILPNLTNPQDLVSVRHLYCQESLGIDKFISHQEMVNKQMGNIEDKFRSKMSEYVGEESNNMIFTEDLKNMIHLTKNDEDLNLVINMMKKFNQQNKQLRFGNYTFGPVVMRLFYILNKPELALDSFLSSDLSGFFEQLITYQLLFDLLYENQKYQEILDTFHTLQERQVQGAKFPRNVVVLVLAACYKLNTKQSLEYALNLWKQFGEVGHFPNRRATTFCAALAINQNKPDMGLEILHSTRNQNYATVRNLKVSALVDLGRIDEVIPILKSILNEDVAVQNVQTFNADIIKKVKEAVDKLNSPDLSVDFNRIYNIFQKQGHISDMTLDQHLCTEIQALPFNNNINESGLNQFRRQFDNRYNNNQRYNPRFRERDSRQKNQREFRQRPGLTDLV